MVFIIISFNNSSLHHLFRGINENSIQDQLLGCTIFNRLDERDGSWLLPGTAEIACTAARISVAADRCHLPLLRAGLEAAAASLVLVFANFGKFIASDRLLESS